MTSGFRGPWSYLGVGFSAARRGFVVWFGPVKPIESFTPSRLIMSASDGRRWDLPAKMVGMCLEVDGDLGPLRPVSAGQLVRVGIGWVGPGAFRVLAGLFGEWRRSDVQPSNGRA